MENFNYIDGLNEPQREGVLNTEGPCMIIAGAGSGKTRVLTHRIAYMIAEKALSPFSIMALTFTNKAAREMRRRVEELVGTQARSLWIGTFHSVFSRILRVEAERLGYPKNFTIYDTEDSTSLIKAIVREMGLDEDRYKPKLVLNRISSAKNSLIDYQGYLQSEDWMQEDAASQRPEIGAVYKNYALRGFKAGAMDFDDLLLNTDKLFREHLDVLNKYQHRISHVLVDEFQDTNLCQYFIIRKLAAVHQNICVVGDDAQSIYAFRGANISNMLNFERDYPQLRLIKLEQNYRSTQTIVGAANSVIAKNRAQIHKSSWTSNEQGESLTLIRAMSDNEEGRLIASSLFEEKMQRQLRFSDFAILYRTNSQSRAIEDAFRRANIKYRVIGGLSFYQRKEIKDLLAYLRFVINQQDEVSLRRIINFPKRGIGDTTLDKLIVMADEQGVSLWEMLEHAKHVTSGRALGAIDEFVNLIKRCAVDTQTMTSYEAALAIAKGSGLMRAALEERTPEGQSRYENMQELLNSVKEFSEQADRDDKSLGGFLQEVSLLTSNDEQNAEEDVTERVTLMTMHMAKGLEFSHVYVAGMEEELFPSTFMLNSQSDLEEERRLFYVAITRAKNKLFLSYALTRYRFGQLKNCEPSRFISDIASQYVKATHSAFSQSGPGSQPIQRDPHWVKSLQKARRLRPIPSSQKTTLYADFVASDTSNLQLGMQVEHPKFGIGKVTAMGTSDGGGKATVDFRRFGERTLLLSFAKLKILSE